ncbi:MAG: hypothetical protein AAF909_06485 [Pseudomonadota bacterium]
MAKSTESSTDWSTQTPSAPPPPICTLWIGERLPDFHNLCLRSWRAMGHEVRFYSYGAVENVPEGVAVRDAEDVFPRAALEDPARRIPVVIRSDIWRIAMLQRGLGVWCDADVLLLRPIPHPNRLLLGVEAHGLPCIAVMWWPPDHPALAEIMAVFDRMGLGPWSYAKPIWKRALKRLSGAAPDFSDYPWNHWGRHAFQYYVRKYRLREAQLGPRSFFAPEVYDGSLFRERDFEHLLADPEVIGLHCFYKEPEAFEAAPEGSLIHWAKARFGGA